MKCRHRGQLSYDIEEAVKESTHKLSSEIDSHILLWTLQNSAEDHELEQFFANIPNFCSSKVLKDPLATFKGPNGKKMADALVGLLGRTLLSKTLSHSTKQRWIAICNRAMAEASLPINRRTLECVLYNDWGRLLDSAEFGLFLKNLHYSDDFAEYYSQCLVSIIITKVQEHDEHWYELATDQLGISKSTLKSYLAHGDSMLLANLIFICRQTIIAYPEHGWQCNVYSRSKTLQLVS